MIRSKIILLFSGGPKLTETALTSNNYKKTPNAPFHPWRPSKTSTKSICNSLFYSEKNAKMMYSWSLTIFSATTQNSGTSKAFTMSLQYFSQYSETTSATTWCKNQAKFISTTFSNLTWATLAWYWARLYWTLFWLKIVSLRQFFSVSKSLNS